MRAFLKQPWVIIAVLAWMVGWVALGHILNQAYWNTRFVFPAVEKVDPSFVLVRVDDGRRIDGHAWTAGDDARVLRKVADAGPRAVFLDRRSDSPLDPSLTQQIAAMGDRVTVVVRGVYSPFGQIALHIPPEFERSQVRVAVSAWQTNLWMFAEKSAGAFSYSSRTYPALSAALAGVAVPANRSFVPDFHVGPLSVRTISAPDLLNGNTGTEWLRGRTVVVSHVRNAPDGVLGYYGAGWRDPVYVDIAAASGLRHGLITPLNGFPLLIVFAVAVFGAMRLRQSLARRGALLGVVVTAVMLPAILQSYGIFMSSCETLLAIVVFFGTRMWLKWRRKVRETSQSGLPNFVALASEKALAEADVVVGVIARYEEFLASIPPELHGECARQIARRFAVGCGARTIHHGEAGFFAWAEPAREQDQQLDHLEGMRALFAAPLLVGGHMFDTTVHFGLDRNHKLDAQSRINTALASASEALRHGRPVELFQADRLANAAWELSLLARIDEGMRNGDIWLAYQPQWDYREARISGAEALIRWNDPVRGPIRPDEFILQAERAGRIDALTYWVLEQAIGAAEEFNAVGPRFQTSINLSAQLVDKPGLISSVTEIVRRRGIDCSLLTVEVTETAHLGDRPAAIHNLRQLQTLGFRLSIDDFGTGEASLLYLAELPSDELKIDREFVSRVVHHERERHIVSSTVRLAHALGQTVVAEGIEDLATFDLLRKLGCDSGQGYYIGRPETLAQLRARYTAKEQSQRGRV